MTLLCIDVENTYTTVGLFVDEELRRRWLLSTERRRTPDEWRLVLAGLLDATDDPPVDGVCVCSTVPAVLAALRTMLDETFPGRDIVILGPGVRTGLPVLTDNPREVGTDRIVNALGALELVDPPCLVVGLGTATTFDVVNRAGQYVGGVIAPGLDVSAAALAEHAAQLRHVELVRPRQVVGKNTVSALQAGALFGWAGLVDGIVDRIAAELDAVEELVVLGTGVLAAAVLPECRTPIRLVPELALSGMRIAFERNQD